MALIHEFILIEKEKYSADYYLSIERDSNGRINMKKSNITYLVELHDDIIQYISDSLNWIPSINPSTNQNGFGLNHYGMTLFNSNSADIIRNIFSSWARLLENAPQEFEITGNYTWDSDKSNGSYEKIQIIRNEIVESFKTLSTYAEKLSDNGFYLLHLGI